MKRKDSKRKSNNIILEFFIHVFYGVYFIFYIIFYPVVFIVKKLNKKQSSKSINPDELNGKTENNQKNIDKLFDKKLKEEKNNQTIVVKDSKKEAKLAAKREKEEQIRKQKEEKKQAELEKKRIEKEKHDEIERQKKEKKDAILAAKREKEEQRKELKEEKKQAKLEKKRIEKEKRDEIERQKKEKKDAILAAKREKEEQRKKQKEEKREVILAAKREKEEQRKKLKEEKKQAKLEKKKLLSDKHKSKEEIALLKAEKKREKKAAKEQARLDKKEAALAKKRKNEAYISDKYDETAKSQTGVKGFFAKLAALPKRIGKEFTDKWHNSMLYKNAQNKKDRQRQVLLINFDGDDAVKSEQKQVYQYVGKNADGKVVTDYFPAYSRVEVHSFLLSEGFEVYSIKTSKFINIFHKSSANVNKKFKTKDLIFFLTQLSTYIKAGIPLVESLKILSRQFKKKTYQKIFRAMIYNLTMGDSFSIAMEKQGRAFPNLLINMIKASEMTGELPEALDDMAEYYTQAEATRKQMITALTYPTIVFVVALAVITFIMLYVVPKFVDIYNSMDSSSIPAFTLFVMNLSDFLQHNIFMIFGTLFAIIILIVVAYKNLKGFRWASQWLFMHIPVIKNIIIYNEVTMFTKTFASLLSHNVFITDTLEILSKITNNEIYKLLVKDTAANLERGEKISTAYKDQWAFPIPAYEMIVTGERTGQLAEMMSKVSTYYQDLHKNTVARLKAFVEPILIVGLTVVVGFIVLAIVIPMFNLYNQVI